MANRRSVLGAGLSGLGDALGGYFGKKMQDEDLLKRQTLDDARGAENAAAGEKQKLFAAILQKLMETNPAAAANLTGAKMDPRDAVSSVSANISKAHNPNEALTPEDITNQYRSNPAGNMTPDYLTRSQNPGQGGTLDSTNITTKANPDLRSVLEQGAARSAMLQGESNKPTGMVEQANPDGSKVSLPNNPRTAPVGGIQTGLSADQAGKNEATKTLAGPLDPRVVQGEVRKSGAIAGAMAAAQEPYKDPTATFDPDGNMVGLKYNPRTKSYDRIDAPQGLSKTPPKPLTQSEVETVASLNVAETEGVKVLSTLHKLGLDKSNDPMDPRWEKFVVGTLKVAPGDYAKADIQQRTAYVKAALTRSLMGARPSQYVAKIIQEHIPDGNMTGEQLSHVVNNVLQQAGEKRSELSNVSGKQIPGPVSGGYEGYQKTLGTEVDPVDAILEKLKARVSGLPPMAPVPSHKGGN